MIFVPNTGCASGAKIWIGRCRGNTADQSRLNQLKTLKTFQNIGAAVETWKKQSALKSLSASSLAGLTAFQILSLRN